MKLQYLLNLLREEIVSYFWPVAKLSIWIKALRLRTLPLSVSGILLGSAAAFREGFVNYSILSYALLTTILFQIISNLSNDLGDTLKGTDNEDRIGPSRSVQSGGISPSTMKKAIILFSILAFASALLLIAISSDGMTANTIWFYIGLAITSIVAAIAYTIGKRAYGYHGFGDLMVLIFFGFVSVLGVYTLYSKLFTIDNILLALYVGLLSVAVLNLNNMRDYHNDAKSGKQTLIVKMGPNQGKFYHVLLILIAISSMIIYINKLGNPLFFVSLVPALYLIYHIRLVMKVSNPADFDPELKKIALVCFFSSLLFFLIVLIP